MQLQFFIFRFKETYLDALVVMPVSAVYFIKPGDNLAAILAQPPPTSSCSTADIAGAYVAATFNDFQSCAYSTAVGCVVNWVPG